MVKLIKNYLLEDVDAVKKYYPNIPDNTFMELIALDPTYTGKNSLGKYGKWILNLYNRGKITEKDFEEIPDLLDKFIIYRSRIQNKDLNTYKTLEDLAYALDSVFNDDSMLTISQKMKYLKKVKKGKIEVRTAHSLNKVPFIIVDDENTYELNEGEFGLANVAPTVAKIMNLKAPASWEQSIVK